MDEIVARATIDKEYFRMKLWCDIYAQEFSKCGNTFDAKNAATIAVDKFDFKFSTVEVDGA